MVDQVWNARLEGFRKASWNGLHWVDVALVVGICLFPLISAYKIWANSDGLLKYVCAVVLIGAVVRGSVRQEAARIAAGIRTPLGAAAIVAVAYVFLSVLWAPDIGASLSEALSKIGLIAAAVVVGTRLALISSEPLQGALATMTVIGLVLLFVDAVTGFSVVQAIYGAILNARINPNVMALSMLAWPAIGTLTLNGKGDAGFAVWLLTGVAVALSPSEAAQLGYVVASVVLVLSWWSFPLAAWTSVAIGIGGLLLAPFIATAASFAMAALPASWTASAHVPERIEIWARHVASIEQAPLLGIGFRNISGNHPHNAALQIWVEFGAVGVLLAAALVVLTGLALLRSPNPRRSFVLACAMAIYANAYVSFGLWERQWLGIMLTVAVIAFSGLAVRASASERG